jgi:hypothetical protein
MGGKRTFGAVLKVAFAVLGFFNLRWRGEWGRVLTWLAVALLGVAGVFGYAAWAGWKSGITRLPLSLLAIEEFERGHSPHFWPVTAFNAVVSTLALAAAGFAAWTVFGVRPQPIENLQALNGCYEGEGMPDSMRPRNRSKAFRIADGVIFDREGRAVSTIRLLESTSSATRIGFSPGILISTGRAKQLVISAGSTEAAEAYTRGGRAYISIPDRLFDIHTTSCG